MAIDAASGGRRTFQDEMGFRMKGPFAHKIQEFHDFAAWPIGPGLA